MAVALGRFLLGKATFFVLVAAAAGAGIIASGFGHRGRHLRAGKDASLVFNLLADANSMSCFSTLTRTSPLRRDGSDARCAGARCIPPGIACVLPRPCPCCGGRMLIIETFARGATPRHKATPMPPVITVDTS